MAEAKTFVFNREEFFKGSVPDTRFFEITKKLIQEENSKLIDEVYLKRCQAQKSIRTSMCWCRNSIKKLRGKNEKEKTTY